MNLLAIGCLFVGYVLVYAGIANHGAFASDPWAGVLGDAYTTGEAPASPDDGSTPSKPSAQPVRPRAPLPARGTIV